MAVVPHPVDLVSYGSFMDAASDSRLTFDRVPDIYDQVRPTYPDELFQKLFAVLPTAPSILEIGPGTGQATQALLGGGAQVTAVELGPALADFLREKFVGDPSLTVVNASFEEADLGHDNFDAVVAATSYHWIPLVAQIERPLELLTPSGVLAVIDLIQVDSPTDHGYFERVQPIYDSFNNGRSDWEPKTYASAMPKIASHLEASGRYESIEVHRVPWDQTYTSDQYRNLLITYSGTQMMAEPMRSNMVDQLVSVIDDEFRGTVTRPLVATLTLGRVRENHRI